MKKELKKCAKLDCNNKTINKFCSHKCRFWHYQPLISGKFQKFCNENPGFFKKNMEIQWSKGREKFIEGHRRYSKNRTPEQRRKFINSLIAERNLPLMKEIRGRNMQWGLTRWRAEKTKIIYKSLKGNYKNSSNIPCRNKFDEIAFQKCDENPTIISWNFLNDFIPIKNKDETFNSSLFIDITVHKNKEKIFIFIRPEGINLKEMNKFSQAEKWCLENNISIDIWTIF